MVAKKNDETLRTYLIYHRDGSETQVDVPENWKVTFGPAARGKNDGTTVGSRGPQIPLALRFYENGEKQRAIFTDVVGFRDMSIPIRIKKRTTQEKDGYMECDGVRKQTRFQAVVEEWVNPDEMQSRLATPALPSDSSMFDLEGGD